MGDCGVLHGPNAVFLWPSHEIFYMVVAMEAHKLAQDRNTSGLPISPPVSRHRGQPNSFRWHWRQLTKRGELGFRVFSWRFHKCIACCSDTRDPASFCHILQDTTSVLLQEAVDSEGRARFHGAFTGGFSAGYYNSVGSSEGWAPATFRSSRESRAAAR